MPQNPRSSMPAFSRSRLIKSITKGGRRASCASEVKPCNVFGLDPNCKQQTSPPRPPGGVELLYSRQHAVFSERRPVSRSRRHLRRESTHLLLTSCNVFGLDPNCKQQTSPPRPPGGVELLYSRQHAVFSERRPVSRSRRHLRREPTHLLLTSPHLLSYAPRLFSLSLPRPHACTRLAYLKSQIMYRLSGKPASSCRYAFSAKFMH